MAEQPRRGGREPVEGKPWSITSVRALLGKPRLVGDLTYKGDVVGRGRWEPILDRETFANLQTALTSRARGNRAASNLRRYLLSGIATCGGCGAGLQTGVQNAGNAYRRYRCPNPARGAGGGVRHGGRNMAALDEYVVSCLFDLLEVLRDVDLAPGEVDPTPEIERLRDRLNEAADQYADDLITAEQFHRLTARYRVRIDQLEQTRPSPADRSLLEWYLGTEDREQALREWERLDLSQQRGIIGAHLGQRGQIKVYPAQVLNKGLDTSTIKITWSA
jgi:site-specific DNA recombinase